MEFIKDYLDKLKAELDSLDIKGIKKAADILFDAWKNNRQVFIFGNGGSAATASHFACDLGKGTLAGSYDKTERRFRVISLTDNVSTITAYANDLSYDDIFVQQLKNLVQEGDVVIAITGSGNSVNVLKGVEYANEIGATTIGFLGFDGGKLKKMVNHSILLKSSHYGRVEDSHLILEHLICSYLAKKIKEESQVLQRRAE